MTAENTFFPTHRRTFDAFHFSHFRSRRETNTAEEEARVSQEQLEEIVLEPDVPCPIERRVYERGKFYTHEEYGTMNIERNKNALGMRHTVAIVKAVIQEIS